MRPRPRFTGHSRPGVGGDDIMIVAHHLSSGEWLLMMFDGAKLEPLRGDLADRALQALHGLAHKSA